MHISRSRYRAASHRTSRRSVRERASVPIMPPHSLEESRYHKSRMHKYLPRFLIKRFARVKSKSRWKTSNSRNRLASFSLHVKLAAWRFQLICGSVNSIQWGRQSTILHLFILSKSARRRLPSSQTVSRKRIYRQQHTRRRNKIFKIRKTRRETRASRRRMRTLRQRRFARRENRRSGRTGRATRKVFLSSRERPMCLPNKFRKVRQLSDPNRLHYLKHSPQHPPAPWAAKIFQLARLSIGRYIKTVSSLRAARPSR